MLGGSKAFDAWTSSMLLPAGICRGSANSGSRKRAWSRTAYEMTVPLETHKSMGNVLVPTPKLTKDSRVMAA